MRSIHLGLDYGTSASKLILRELDVAGGSKAHIVPWKGGFRIPSAVAFDGTHLRLGDEAPGAGWTVLTSVKMHAAREVRGEGERCPVPGLSWGALVVWSLRWLLSLAQAEAARIGRVEPRDIDLEFFLGIPATFLDDPRLKAAFQGFGGAAGSLLRTQGPLTGCDFAIQDVAKQLAAERARHPDPAELFDDYRLHAESKAALQWALNSPAVARGPYVEVDIGAGTTHASFFRLHGDGIEAKDRIPVFGAVSVDVGMDDLGAALINESDKVRDRGALLAIRGRESEQLRTRDGIQRAQPVLDHMYGAIRRAWELAREKLNQPPETGNWGRPGICFAGGGSLVGPVVARFLEVTGHPPCVFQKVEVGLPLDLQGLQATPEVMAFLQVAYGLSDPALEFVEMRTPSKIEPMEAPILGPSDARCGCDGTDEGCPRCGGYGIIRGRVATQIVERPGTSSSGKPVTKTNPRMRAARQDFVRCPQCQAEVTVEGLESHIRDRHEAPSRWGTGRMQAPQELPKGPKVPCPECGLAVVESQLATHRTRHFVKRPQPADGKVPCHRCGARVPQSQLRAHMAQVHKAKS